MRINILFFASLRDYTGTKTIEMEIRERTSVAMLKESLLERYPRLAQAKNSVLVAVNREYAADEQIIPKDAEIAFFPPVSGG